MVCARRRIIFMKLKNTLLASALLSATALSANAATELTPEQAAALKPFDHTVIVGRYNSIGDAVAAASKAADKNGRPRFMLLTSLIMATAATSASPLRCIKTMRQKLTHRKTA
jgi:NAD(P)H-hydrate repair Nnr-like enzyme with NAD(P)H-hydrate epimerase domain